jgi:hypothetical protein
VSSFVVYLGGSRAMRLGGIRWHRM